MLLVASLRLHAYIYWTRLFDICLIFIVLPSTYILNRETTKEIIALRNWYQGIKSIFVINVQVEPVAGPVPEPPVNLPHARNASPHQEAPEMNRNASLPPEVSSSSGITSQPPDDPAPSSPASPSNHDNSNVFVENQSPEVEVIPLGNVRIIQVASANE